MTIKARCRNSDNSQISEEFPGRYGPVVVDGCDDLRLGGIIHALGEAANVVSSSPRVRLEGGARDAPEGLEIVVADPGAGLHDDQAEVDGGPLGSPEAVLRAGLAAAVDDEEFLAQVAIEGGADLRVLDHVLVRDGGFMLFVFVFVRRAPRPSSVLSPSILTSSSGEEPLARRHIWSTMSLCMSSCISLANNPRSED